MFRDQFNAQASPVLVSVVAIGSQSLLWVRRIKTPLYGVLFLNAVIWLTTGYPIYAWDAILWIIGFWAIELNLAEWETDRVLELAET